MKTGAAPATQIRVLHFIGDRFRRHAAVQDLADRLVTTGLLIGPQVQERPVGTHPFCQRFFGGGCHLYLLECRIDFLRIQIAVQIAVHHHGRGMIAASETHDRQQREAIVGRRLAKLDTQALVEMLPHTRS